MGTTASKPSGEAPGAAPAQKQQQGAPGAPAAACPLGFDKMVSTAADEAAAAPSPSSEASAAASAAAPSSSCPVKTLLPGGSGSASTSAPAGDSSSGCPVKAEHRPKVAKYLHPHKYNVYSQRIDTTTAVDPTNNMPAKANQQPAPGQEKPLSTDRVPSTIPKGGEESTWTYPSPQMFWNALTRKGKAEGTEEDDMDVVVSIHNNMNELTWKKILEWEKIRSRGAESGDTGEDGSEPRLLRFLGRPNDTTPKALAKMMLGHPLPFDRHDWVVDRGGDERRYVIDYYYDDGAEDEDGVPELHSEGAVKSIKVDVRPALDGFRDLADRLVQMPLARLTGKSDFVPLSLRPSPTMKAREPWAQLRTRQGLPSSSAVGEAAAAGPSSAEVGAAGATAAATAAVSSSSRATRKQLERDARAMERVKKKCAKPFELLRAAEGAGDAERARAAALKLEFCTARYACRKEAQAYREALSYAGATGSIIGGDPAHSYWAESALDRSLDEMRGALAAFTERQVEAAARRRGEGEGGVEGAADA